MVASAQELTGEIARTLHDELARVGLLPKGDPLEWDQLSERTRAQWIDASSMLFLSLSRARATHTPYAADRRASTRTAAVVGTKLSNRERTILDALGNRATIRQIAMHEYISPNTVKTHVRSIYRKLGISSREEAIVALRAIRAAEMRV